MRRSALISFGIHLAIVLAAIISLPPMKLESTADESVSVDLIGPSAPQEAMQAGKVAAPADTPVLNKSALAVKQPKPQPIQAPPPPPPPPPAPKVIPKVVEIDNGLHAPTKIPKDIKMIKESAPPPPPGMGVAGMEGMAGGAPGGVFGGIVGGHGPAIHVEPPKPTGPMRISGGVIAGNRIAFVQPEYPPIAKIAHMSGVVVLHAIISKSGSVVNLEVSSSTNPMFNNYAIQAVRQWRYRPYLLNGEPTEVDTTITVNFSLNGDD